MSDTPLNTEGICPHLSPEKALMIEKRDGLDKVSVFEFHERLAAFCAEIGIENNCRRCPMSLYCESAPESITHDLIREVLKRLDISDMEKRMDAEENAVAEKPCCACKIDYEALAEAITHRPLSTRLAQTANRDTGEAYGRHTE